MNKIQINNKFLIFILFNIFYVIFYLYFKHEVGNDTSISEWLINYQGGFTRRGLGGEINIFFADFFSISLRDTIFFVQSIIHVSYLLLLYFYLKNINLNLLQLFALFSPLFLLYPIAELEALGRKELLIFLFFITIIFLSNEKFKPVLINFIIFIFFPIICFVWEQIVLFAPYFAVVLICKNKLKTFNEVFIKLIIIFSPSIIALIIIFLYPLSNEGHVEMCNFLQNNFDERCYMSANLLIKNTIYFDTFYAHESMKFFPHYFRYIMIFIVGFLPLHLVLYNNEFIGEDNFVKKYFKPLYLYLSLYLPILLLFAFGHDWGRWIHIMYSLSILLYFYLLKNSMISNFSKENFFSKFFQNRKKLLIFVFFIFAFSWNPKTLLTGDIATNSLYKIIYNSSKIIFNHGGLRILQDNPIIKFHKKYLE